MANFAGWQKHLHLVKETDWGQLPASPSYLYVPYANYTVAANLLAATADLFTGVRQRRHHQITRAFLAGELACPLYSYHSSGKSIAQHLLEWVTSAPNDVDLQSYTAELYEADTDNKRHVGLRPSRGILAGDADSGGIDLSISLEGKSEEGGITTQVVDPNAPSPVEFLFRDTTFSLNGVSLPLQSFQIQFENNLRRYHNNSYWPSLLTAGIRDISFEFSLFKSDDTFDVMRRIPPEESQAQLVLKGAHNGTGPASTNYTTITIDFTRLAFRNVSEEGLLSELQRQRPQFVALKPDSTASEVTFTYGAVA